MQTKIKFIILGMAATLLLPLAGANARISTAGSVDQLSGGGFVLPGEASDEGEMKRRRGSRDKGSKGSKGWKKDKRHRGRGGSRGSRASRGSKGSRGSASDS